MDILLYLSELLKQHNEVGVAGLGTFYKKKFAGRYDKEQQAFLPPGYTLQFTTDVKEADLLSNYIVEKTHVSNEQAGNHIVNLITETNKKLEIDHEAELENIGRLFYTEHEGLSFEPSANINFGSVYFGLPSVAETQPPILANDDNGVKPTIESDKDLNEDEQTYDEIDEAPTHHLEQAKQEQILPQIENIELDEVNDDLKHTLGNKTQLSDAEEPAVEVPEFVKEQHQEHPNRFGHQLESEEPKTFINLEEEPKEQPVVPAPEFIKEQHAEHPNRFGHSQIIEEAVEQDEKSAWSKIWIAVLAVILLIALAYFIKPEWFGASKLSNNDAVAVIDSTIATTPIIDSAKLKQDSIAKTDSILKVNQIGKAKDSIQASTVNTKTNVNSKNDVTTAANNPTEATFDVIAASFKSESKAKVFIKQMERYGLKAKIANLPGRLKKVSIASYKTEAEARAQRPELAKKIKIKELDIIQVNNTP